MRTSARPRACDVPNGSARPTRLARWQVFQFNAARPMEAHGVALQAAGWDGLDLFGLHGAAPVTNPSGWGVAWLLERGGVVLDVAPDATLLRLLWKRNVRDDRSVTWPLYRRPEARHTVARNMPNSAAHVTRAHARVDKRPFQNQGGTFGFGGWSAGPDVIPSRCSKPCWRSHVDADHPRAA